MSQNSDGSKPNRKHAAKKSKELKGMKGTELRTIRIEIQNVPESVVDEEAFLIHRLIDAKRSRLNDEASFKGWMVGMRDWLDRGIAGIDPKWKSEDLEADDV